MKGYFDVSGLRRCEITFYFPKELIKGVYLDLDRITSEGFDCAISISNDYAISALYCGGTRLEPFLWIKTSDINFDLSNVKCNRKIEVTYKYRWHQWIARFAIIAYRKLTGDNNGK